MKKIIIPIVSVIVAMSFIVTGCGGGSGSGSGAGSDSGKGTKECFEYNDDKITGLTNYGNSQKDIVIPASCKGFVGSITKEASFTSVSFESDDDISLGLAFAGSTTLEKITLPKNLSSLDNMAFQKCSALESITIPDGVTEIPLGAFNECTNLKNVSFGGSVTSIGNKAFAKCSSLDNVQFPSTVQTLENEAFFRCTSITAVELPDGLTKLGSSVFKGCTSLTTIKLSSSLKEVGQNVIVETAVTDIYVPADMELTSWDIISFFNPKSDITIKVHITEGSWADEHFDEVFEGAEKSYG